MRALWLPRTVCFCQPVRSATSTRVTPPGRRIRSTTSAFLLTRFVALAVAALIGRDAFWPLADLPLFLALFFFLAALGPSIVCSVLI